MTILWMSRWGIQYRFIEDDIVDNPLDDGLMRNRESCAVHLCSLCRPKTDADGRPGPEIYGDTELRRCDNVECRLHAHGHGVAQARTKG